MIINLGMNWENFYAFDTFKDFIHNLEEPTYEVAPNKWVVTNNEGKPLYYFNGDNCIINKTQNPHVFAILTGIGNSYSGTFTKLLDEESAYGTIASQCANNNYCRIVLIENEDIPL